MNVPWDLAAALGHTKGRVSVGHIEQGNDQILSRHKFGDGILSREVDVEVEGLACLDICQDLIQGADIDEGIKAFLDQPVTELLGRALLCPTGAHGHGCQRCHGAVRSLDIHDHHPLGLLRAEGQNVLLLILDQGQRILGNGRGYGGKPGIVEHSVEILRSGAQVFLCLLVQAHGRFQSQNALQRLVHPLPADHA